mmetsp:Transcript_5418/g.10945  ORF Transcript_5418/g.10945 Transcript_5418/m.10945 type:complete len:216 (-) Transcript_5418:153-800(-)
MVVVHQAYGTLESGTRVRRRGNGASFLASAIALTAALAVVCVVALLAHETRAVVLDDPVEDPMTSSAPPGTDLTEPVNDESGSGGGAGAAGGDGDDGDTPPREAVDGDTMTRAINFGNDPDDPSWDGLYEWTSSNADGYDPEKQNVLNDEDAFETPFAGYAPKNLKYSAPSAPETNVLDYLPSGPFSEPKSMELRMLKGPYDPPENAWAENPLDK